MSLEDRFAQHDGLVVDKYINPTNADASMTTRDYVVRVDASTALVTITLPNVAEAKGRWYSILVRDATETVVIQDNDDSENWADITISTSPTHIMLYSDGMSWAAEYMGDAGEVNSVTASSPVASTGGANPVISMAAATASTAGHATAAQITKLDGIEESADVTDATNIASSVHGVSGKTTPVDGDELGLIDSAASDALKVLTWANVKATLKAYLDTLYSTITHASNHTDGTDDIQSATNAQKGLATDSHISALEAATAAQHDQDTDTDLGALGTKDTPIDADKVVYRDSTDSDALVTATMAELKDYLEFPKLVNGKIEDVSTGANHYCIMPFAGNISAIYTVLHGAIVDADAGLTFKIGAGGTLITGSEITIAHDGSAAGDVDSSAPTAANTVAVGDVVEMITDGASTNDVDVTVVFEISA